MQFSRKSWIGVLVAIWLSLLVMRVIQQGVTLSMIIAIVAAVAVGFVLKFTIWKAPQVVTGGLYAMQNADGTYQVAKVLKVDEHAVHVCIYRNVFPGKPTNIDPSTLTLSMTLEDFDTIREGKKVCLGMMHVPIDKNGFWKSNPAFIMKAVVTEEDLEGYNY